MTSTSGFLFYAYGDMASKRHMEAIDASVELMGPAKLPNYRISFTDAGDANLLPDVGGNTWGTLWMVPAVALPGMDEVGMAKNLKRSVVHVVSPAGITVPATAYYNPTILPGKPAPLVLSEAIAATRAMGLDRRYLRRLLAMER